MPGRGTSSSPARYRQSLAGLLRAPRDIPCPAPPTRRSAPARESRTRPRRPWPDPAPRNAGSAASAEAVCSRPFPRPQHLTDGLREARPDTFSLAQLALAFIGQPVVLGPAVLLGGSRLGLDPALRFQPVHGRTARAALGSQSARAGVRNTAADPVSVHGPPGERLEDDDFEGPVQELGFHASP